jgi:hypothetical protein
VRASVEQGTVDGNKFHPDPIAFGQIEGDRSTTR